MPYTLDAGVPDDRFLTAGEAADVLRVDVKTLGRYCSAGHLGAEGVDWFRTPGGHRRVRAGALRRFIRRGGSSAERTRR